MLTNTLMSIQILLVIILTFLINLITTLSYSVRIVGIRTGRIAISFALFNILVLISRTANGFQASSIEKNIKSGLESNLTENLFPKFYFMASPKVESLN